MTPSQVKYAATKYAMRLASLGAIAVRQPTSAPAGPRESQLDHAAWMCSGIEQMFERGELEDQHGSEKAMRWLGFVQGILWCAGAYTIDDMKDDNRSAKVKSAPPSGG